MNEFRPINDVAEVRRGASPRPIADPKFFGGSVGWVRIVDVTGSNKYLRQTTQYLSALGEASSVRVDKGDLIMSICATIGKPVIVDMPACIHDGFVQFYDLKEIDTEYLYYVLQLAERDFVAMGQMGTQANLNTDLVRRHEIFVPKRGEQKRIAKILANVDVLIEKTEALIEKYQAIKQGLMHDLFTRGIDANGQLRPRYEDAPHLYKQTELGWIPKGWEVSRLVNCVRDDAPICYGILMPGESVHGGIPVIKVKDINDGKIYQDDLLLTHPEIEAQYRRSRLKADDLLITIRGTTGRVALVPPGLEAANITQDTARVRLRSECLNMFFYFSLQTNAVQAQVALKTLGQAVKGINIADVRNLIVVVPRDHEQREIATRLTSIDGLIDDLGDEREKLTKIKLGLMQDLLTGRIQVQGG